MPCYAIPYRDRYGPHVAIKWGDTPAAAAAALKKARTAPGLGATDYDPPRLVHPQPFSDERPAAATHPVAAPI